MPYISLQPLAHRRWGNGDGMALGHQFIPLVGPGEFQFDPATILNKLDNFSSRRDRIAKIGRLAKAHGDFRDDRTQAGQLHAKYRRYQALGERPVRDTRAKWGHLGELLV